MAKKAKAVKIQDRRDRFSFIPVLPIRSFSAFSPLVGIIFVLVLQATMVFRRAINWDSFWHFHLANLLNEGVLYTPLQTYFIRLFSWATMLPGTAVDQLIVVRMFMFGCEIIVAAAIALLARRFTNLSTGLLAALSYLSVGFVLQHGFSFRADPGLAALAMSALVLLACSPFRGVWVAIFAVLLALASMFSIKIILYAPAFAGIAWLRWREAGYEKAFLFRLLIAGVLTVGSFALLFGYHSTAGVTVEVDSQTVLSRSAQKMFVLGLPPYWMMAIKFAALSVPFFIMMILFPLAIRKSQLSLSEKIAIFGLFLPVITLAFYHNTAPYYYVFMLAPVAVACALPVAMVARRYGVSLVTALFVLSASLVWAQEDFTVIDRQRSVLLAANEIFPEEIAYFDFCGMLPKHRKANIFMTPFMMNFYREGSIPSMVDTMRKEVVPLVIENDSMFTQVLRTRQPITQFLPADATALRETYVHFWGPFWVAGRYIPAGTEDFKAEFRVPGLYVLSGGAVLLDGKRLNPGSAVRIDRGMHELTSLGGAALLRWGKDLRLPASAAPPQPLWVYF
ncbi:hypothetical protein M2336_000737 [Sphingobium sp. B1D7B]|uniref:hypothetical protein n=1 Tax=unclassified Sphingobium TaxID=2611147 RepID=UPI00222453FF|nr:MULTISPECIES: hypothetical protein [unclassified Sphingobium]MCW2392413.1 hypothetical protein [Sphingobium sp. B11D3A]MCW2404108.1 hypothetical protein [Sphingobium sp. B1D7B]